MFQMNLETLVTKFLAQNGRDMAELGHMCTFPDRMGVLESNSRDKYWLSSTVRLILDQIVLKNLFSVESQDKTS